ncbi:hypothetical protein [Pseudoalteromonas sp. SG44-8]|uniref:hypothetical protein n=1 Tax=Pseudoalteromonas sp. SG44-8 TaxID=2760958 RepID=UPI001600B7F1|nr:hypothetical protein [Pseudoalteromonas sp. SG44-8]MBB1397528.1 hypothetical protein [Pseudoalteromonas sp. SG44-8]
MNLVKKHNKNSQGDAKKRRACCWRYAIGVLIISPTSHILMSWLSSNLIAGNVRERRIITASGIAPDIDGFGLLVDPILRMLGYSSNLWGEFHHSLHNLGFFLLVTVTAYLVATVNKFKVAGMAFLLFHLHLICDLIGSKGPDG